MVQSHIIRVCIHITECEDSIILQEAFDPKIRSVLEEGAAYEVENVLVTHNDPKYQITMHKFRLNLIDKTKFIKIYVAKIPVNHFDFVSFAEILESEREDRIIGIFCIIPKLVNFFFLG